MRKAHPSFPGAVRRVKDQPLLQKPCRVVLQAGPVEYLGQIASRTQHLRVPLAAQPLPQIQYLLCPRHTEALHRSYKLKHITAMLLGVDKQAIANPARLEKCTARWPGGSTN